MDKTRFRQLLRQIFWTPFAVATMLAAILLFEVPFLVRQQGWVARADRIIAVLPVHTFW